MNKKIIFFLFFFFHRPNPAPVTRSPTNSETQCQCMGGQSSCVAFQTENLCNVFSTTRGCQWRCDSNPTPVTPSPNTNIPPVTPSPNPIPR